MNFKIASESSTPIRTPYLVIQRCQDRIEITQFRTARSMDDFIEMVCVSAGEEGRKDNIIYQSKNYDELQYDIRQEVSQ